MRSWALRCVPAYACQPHKVFPGVRVRSCIPVRVRKGAFPGVRVRSCIPAIRPGAARQPLASGKRSGRPPPPRLIAFNDRPIKHPLYPRNRRLNSSILLPCWSSATQNGPRSIQHSAWGLGHMGCQPRARPCNRPLTCHCHASEQRAAPPAPALPANVAMVVRPSS
jgi:hypothetical protein